MSKTLLFAITIVIGIVINITVLYAVVLGLRTELGTVSTKVSSLEKSIANNKPSIPTPVLDMTASESATDSLCVNCRQDIEIIKKMLAGITPPAGTSFATIPKETGASAKEFFVPLGSGKTTSKEWEDVPGMSATIDTRNYTGIKSVVFEISLRIPTANGVVYARLFNKTDSHPVWNSEVSSEGPTAILKQSPNFVLDTGEKIYQVQMKSSLAFDALADSARIKIILQ